MRKSDHYKELFNKQFLMGPNSIRMLEEMLETSPLESGLKILDLGCGRGLTSLFLAKETTANVFAVDLWISAAENYEQFKKWGIDHLVIPIHADANDLPFAEHYFDAIVSIDSFHYFATQPDFLHNKILPLLKKDGRLIIAMPGLKEEIHGLESPLMMEWVNGEENEYELFHSKEWWRNHFGNRGDFEIEKAFDLDCFDLAWEDWFLSNHPFAIRDREYFEKGIDKYLSLVGFVIRRKSDNMAV